jgi:hypothetical protein
MANRFRRQNTEAVKGIVALLEEYAKKPKVTESAGVALYEEKLASDL